MRGSHYLGMALRVVDVGSWGLAPCCKSDDLLTILYHETIANFSSFEWMNESTAKANLKAYAILRMPRITSSTDMRLFDILHHLPLTTSDPAGSLQWPSD